MAPAHQFSDDRPVSSLTPTHQDIRHQFSDGRPALKISEVARDFHSSARRANRKSLRLTPESATAIKIALRSASRMIR